MGLRSALRNAGADLFDRPRRLAVAASVAGLAAAWLATRGIQWGEGRTVESLNDLPGPVVDALEIVMQLGARPAIVLVAAVAVVVLDRSWRTVVLTVVLAGAVAWGAATVGKDLVDRGRPAALGVDVDVHDTAEGPGFPSSHTAVATGSLTAAALLGRRRLGAAVGLGATVGVARMAVGVHLPLDVVGGLAVGIVSAVVITELLDR